jgi:hypothetical protein
MARCAARLAEFDAWLWPPTDLRRGWLPRFACCGASRRVAAQRLLAWRCAVGASMLAAALYAWASGGADEAAFYLSYLTYESLWLNLSYFVLASVLGADAILAAPGRPRLLRSAAARATAHRVLSVLLAIAVSFTSVVVVIFWTLLFRVLTTEQKALYLPGNVVVHGVVLLPPWVDMVLAATRLHFRTFAPVALAGLFYLAVNCAVSLTVHPVYSILAWSQPADAAVVVGVFVVLTVAYAGAASIAVAVERAAEPGGR